MTRAPLPPTSTSSQAPSHTGSQAPTRRVLVVEDETLVGMGIRAHLERLGHTVVGQASNESEAVEMYRSQKPDLLIMDICLDRVPDGSSGSATDGIELTRKLTAERRCPVIIVSAFSDEDLVRRAADAGVFGYLIKPPSRESLAAQIRIAIQRFDEQELLRRQKDEADQALEDRKLIDRAKGILMKRLKLSEPDAHRRLQIECQKRRVTLVEIAKKVIESEKLLER
jgi:response regulator NasT